MPNTNVLCAAAHYLDGLGSVRRLIGFSSYVEQEVDCRQNLGDGRRRDVIRATIYHEIHEIYEIHKIVEDTLDKRGIDRANDSQNFEEAYARGEI